jgi:hypothetical protein
MPRFRLSSPSGYQGNPNVKPVVQSPCFNEEVMLPSEVAGTLSAKAADISKSLALGGALVTIAVLIFLFGRPACLIGFNRQLLESTLAKGREIELKLVRMKDGVLLSQERRKHETGLRLGTDQGRS